MNPLILAISAVVGAAAGVWFSHRYKKSHDDYAPNARVRYFRPFTVGTAAITLSAVGTLVQAIASALPAGVSPVLNVGLFGFGLTILAIAVLEKRSREQRDPEESIYIDG